MRRSTFRQITAEARDAPRQTASGPAELSAEHRKQALVEAAARHGLTAEQLEMALRSFVETQDPKDRGIVAYIEGDYAQAEALLGKVADKKGSDLIETLCYLGASQLAQEKYQAAAESFQKALALGSKDPVLLSWFSWAVHRLIDRIEADPLLRQALSIDERSIGSNHPELARDLNNLAQSLAINGLPEMELLMRRALSIDEKNLGQEHPDVARDLNNLAWLLKITNRHAEAEPLMRRALAIDEEHFGPEHEKVAIRLNNLAQLLQAMDRPIEAEPLIRHALVIFAEFERRTGYEHPYGKAAADSYRELLKNVGLTDAEIDAAIKELVRSENEK